jgi:hypothetical protein
MIITAGLDRFLRYCNAEDAKDFINEYMVYLNGEEYIRVEDFVEYLKGNR